MRQRTFLFVTILLTITTTTLSQENQGGDNQPKPDDFKVCPPGQTWTAKGQNTCVSCSTAAHGASCSLCSPASANCLLCDTGKANPSMAGEPCADCATKYPGCSSCMREYNPLQKGCKACAAGFIKHKQDHHYKCTDCGGNIAECPLCGSKNVINCEACSSNYGCSKCAGNWDFKDGGELKLFQIYGECTVCKLGYKIGASGQCDECDDGFVLVNGICAEVVAAECGGAQIEGCRLCGSNDPTKCGVCATGYGLSGAGESSSCIKCSTKGCMSCDYKAPPVTDGQNNAARILQNDGNGANDANGGNNGDNQKPANFNKCTKCVPNRWQFTKDYCLAGKLLAVALAVVGLAAPLW